MEKERMFFNWEGGGIVLNRRKKETPAFNV
jgi:hypothetical protein